MFGIVSINFASQAHRSTRPFKSFGFKTAFVISLSNTIFFWSALTKIATPFGQNRSSKMLFLLYFHEHR